MLNIGYDVGAASVIPLGAVYGTRVAPIIVGLRSIVSSSISLEGIFIHQPMLLGMFGRSSARLGVFGFASLWDAKFIHEAVPTIGRTIPPTYVGVKIYVPE